MNQPNTIEREVLKKITPAKKDRMKLEKTITALIKKVNENLIKHQQKALIELVGSTAKDTYLKDNLDIDLFIIYPPIETEEKIAQTTLQIGRNILNDTEECYAEHPYIRGDFLGFKVELVPCYQITDASEKISAVDRTPLHTKYVKKHLEEKQKQDVRLLKQFLTGIGCYGAEAEIQGFSGYLCELLIIKFHSFHNLLSHVKKWKKGIKITLTDHPIPDFEDPLVFIDPVDKDRNVAAAVVLQTFQRFITASNDYLHQPKETFFFPKQTKPWSLNQIKKTLNKQEASYIGIKFEKPKIIKENLYPQIRKACTAIQKQSIEEEFSIYDIRFYIDNKSNLIYIIIKTSEKPLSETFAHRGPPIKLKKNTKEFIEKWKDNPATVKPPVQQNGRTFVTVKREYRYIKNYLQDNLPLFSLGKHLDAIVYNKYEILSLNELIKPDLQMFWTSYLEDKKPWER
jgi:tRNA nucleotidyltransferase (CCA-adding enzyme)